MKLIIEIDESVYEAFKIRAERKEPVCCTENAYLIQKIIEGTPYNQSGDCISRSVLDEIRQLYKDYQPYLATKVIEFGNALEKLIDNAPTVETFTIEDMQNNYDAGVDSIIGKYDKAKGEWIRYRDNPHQPEHIKCSNCGQYWSIADHDKTFDFCFKCGADMKGGAE